MGPWTCWRGAFHLHHPQHLPGGQMLLLPQLAAALAWKHCPEICINLSSNNMTLMLNFMFQLCPQLDRATWAKSTSRTPQELPKLAQQLSTIVKMRLTALCLTLLLPVPTFGRPNDNDAFNSFLHRSAMGSLVTDSSIVISQPLSSLSDLDSFMDFPSKPCSRHYSESLNSILYQISTFFFLQQTICKQT